MDNICAIIRLHSPVLAKSLGLSFDSLPWEGLKPGALLAPDEIIACRDMGHILPPASGKTGSELTSLSDHTRRIAWLLSVQQEDWDPIILNYHADNGKIHLTLVDGHHRLFASLINTGSIHAQIKIGVTHEIEALLSEMSGDWVLKPPTAVWGDGVFQSTGGPAGAAIRIVIDNNKAWVESMPEGMTIAVYGPQLWTIKVPHLVAKRNRHAIRGQLPLERHLGEFSSIIANELSVDQDGIYQYLKSLG